jgi:hypothetical protein
VLAFYLTFYLTFGEIARLGEIEAKSARDRRQDKEGFALQLRPDKEGWLRFYLLLASCAQPTFYLTFVANAKQA